MSFVLTQTSTAADDTISPDPALLNKAPRICINELTASPCWVDYYGFQKEKETDRCSFDHRDHWDQLPAIRSNFQRWQGN